MGDLSRQRVAALAAVQGWTDDLEAGRRRLTPALAEAIRVELERAARLEAELQREDPQPEKMAGDPVVRPGDAGQAVKGGADQEAGCFRP